MHFKICYTFNFSMRYSILIDGCTAYFGAKEYNKTEESVTEKVAEEAPNDEADETVSEKEETVNEEKEAAEKGSWLSKIQEVAASNKTKTEKFDEVSLLLKITTLVAVSVQSLRVILLRSTKPVSI